jgi:TolB-like protein/DNA-binding winged helix-turn-helix (wHTH) protein
VVTPTQSRILRFGVFEVDLDTGELRKSGMRQKLGGQPFEVLRLLLEHPQQIVTREQLQQRIWPKDTFVDYDLALRKSITRLREVLGDSAESPRFIETVPRRGYRFVASVSEGRHADVITELPSSKSGWSRPRFRVSIVLGLGAAALLLALWGFLHRKSVGRGSVTNAPPEIHSLAVLPLQNLSNEPAQEYFSEGMTDALITDLAQISSLKVISRTSSMQYKQTKKSLPEIASELKVDGIVEGTVQRSGDRVRINAQLIHGPSDKHLWAASYERDMRDVFALERDVTEDIVRHVQERLPRADSVLVAQPRRVDGKALEAYLQGNFRLNGYGKGSGDEEKRTAAQYFQQVIDADPTFAPAYNGLANAHRNLLWPTGQDAEIAKQAAERAVALDPNFSEAHCTLGDINFELWNWQRAEEEYRRAITLNPNNAYAHDDFGYFLDAMGRMDEGWRESQIAQELDPSYDHLSDALARRGRDDQAIKIEQLMLRRNPDDGYEHALLYREYLRMGMYEDAAKELDRMAILFGFPQIAAEARRAHAVSGSHSAIRERSKGWEHLWATHQAFLPVNFAEVYASLGDKERAFYWLEQAYAHHDIGIASTDEPLASLRNDFLLNPLRSDPRFKDLVRRVGLPEIPVGNSAARSEQKGNRQ